MSTPMERALPLRILIAVDVVGVEVLDFFLGQLFELRAVIFPTLFLLGSPEPFSMLMMSLIITDAAAF